MTYLESGQPMPARQATPDEPAGHDGQLRHRQAGRLVYAGSQR